MGAVDPCDGTAGAEKIAFNKFHVAKHLSEAIDRVRRQEQHKPQREGAQRLKGSHYLWLRNPQHKDWQAWVPRPSVVAWNRSSVWPVPV